MSEPDDTATASAGELEGHLFENEALVRHTMIGGEPAFVGADVCHVLGYRDAHQALERLPNDELTRCPIPSRLTDIPGSRQDRSMIVVFEPGLYRLIVTSKKPAAERFKRWVFHEVLPSIRKTGSYGKPEIPHGYPWTLDVRAMNLREVETYRRNFGEPAARQRMREMGFPVSDKWAFQPDLFENEQKSVTVTVVGHA